MTRRTVSEHITLVCNFAACIEALPPAAWQRLQERCRPLAGSTPAALFARARLAALAWDTFPDAPDAPALVRIIPVVTHASIVAMGIAHEVVTSAFPSTVAAPWTRQTSTGKPDADRYMDARNAIERTLALQGVRVAGVATAVRAAAHAVWHHDRLVPATFERVYRWVATEIPYAQVDPAAGAERDAAV
jgi:hypothetical protein